MTAPIDERAERLWRAQQYVFDALAPAERAAFERALALEGAPEREALREALELVAELCLAAPPVEPPPALRERLLARVRVEAGAPAVGGAGAAAGIQPWKQWSRSAGDLFVRAEEGAFEPTARPGISVRKLHVDPARDRATLLIRMEPGARYPAHRHGGPEECYVLSGDLRHGERVMRGGDFERVEHGSSHGDQWTEEGCLLLISSSLCDELL